MNGMEILKLNQCSAEAAILWHSR